MILLLGEKLTFLSLLDENIDGYPMQAPDTIFLNELAFAGIFNIDFELFEAST